MDSLLRFAARSLFKAPGFTLVVVLTLALGIGANTAIFSVINAVLLRPLPYEKPESLVMFWESAPQFGVPYIPISEANFLDWRERNEVFSDMAAFRIRSRANGKPMTLAGKGDPKQINGVTTSSNLFGLLGVGPVLGRDFRAEEDLRGAPKVAILSHSLWKNQFSGDQDILGRAIQLDGVPHEVIGVLPAGFYFPPPLSLVGRVREGRGEVFVPYPLDRDNRNARWIRTVARLEEGVSIGRARRELRAIGHELHEAAPDANPEGLHATLLPIHGQAVDHTRGSLTILLGAVSLILLIACVNVTNLILVRASAQDRHIAIRTALGAGRSSILRMLLAQGLLLSLIGGAAGVLMAALSLELLVGLGASYLPHLGQVVIDRWVLLYSLLLATLTGIVFGIVPAFRTYGPRLFEALKDGGRGQGGRRGLSFRRFLVVIEVALAMLLLVGAGLLVQSLSRIRSIDLGFNPRHVVTARMLLPKNRYPERQDVTAFVKDLVGQVKAIGGVETAGAASHLPFSGGLRGAEFEIQGRSPAGTDSEVAQTAEIRIVDSDYFDTMGIPLLKGRLFDSGDRQETRPVVLVDRGLAETLWPREGPLGARISYPGRPWSEVVGVVEAIRHSNLLDPAPTQGIIYLPWTQNPLWTVSLVARSSMDVPKLSEEIRTRVAGLDSELAIDLKPMESYVQDAQTGLRSPTTLLVLLAVIALSLATVGLYGVISFLVGKRTQEIGVRMAMGAHRSDIVRMVAREVLVLTLSGIAIGAAGALALSGYLSSLLFGVDPADPTTYAIVGLLFIVIAGLSALAPTARALKVQPVQALRSE